MDELDDRGANGLAAAVIRQACEDWVLESGMRGELLAFFKGEWCAALTDFISLPLSGPKMLHLLRRGRRVAERVRAIGVPKTESCGIIGA